VYIKWPSFSKHVYMLYAISHLDFDMNYNLETNIRSYTWLSICNGPQN